MILPLLFAAQAATAAPMTAIDAERAFAADAQVLGQWTAFRKWASAAAVMFTPRVTGAQGFLAPLKDPPRAVFWWPGRSYVSCDGTLAVNTGPWVRGYGKSVGYFTTVWQRQKDGGWKWIYDAGDELPTARAEGGDIRPVIAACNQPVRLPKPPATHIGIGSTAATGQSDDSTLRYSWLSRTDGSREFRAWLWDGKAMNEVVFDWVAAAPPRPAPARPPEPRKP